MQVAPTPRMPKPFGIFADTGRPLPGIDEFALEAFRHSGGGDTAVARELEAKADSSDAHFGTIGDVDPNRLEEAGWAVLFGPGVDGSIREALRPLLDYRRAQAGDRLFKVFEGPNGFQPGDSAVSWLARQKVRMDVVDPLLGVPFYVMIVAPPDEIPYEFQYALDLYWGVGRVWFDTAEEFRQYAESVIRYETMAQVPTSRQMAVFATRHDFDEATQLFSAEVAEPMVNGSEAVAPVGVRQKFALQSFVGDPATKQNLHRIWTGAIPGGTPALLFTGGHGKSFRADDTRQAESQGALICQDWPGYGKLERDHFFDAADLPANGRMHGMVHFLFACYGGGWPQFDNFSRMESTPKAISPKPMMARLPQRLLSHRDGGALAVLAHVDRAWAYSFRSGKTAQIQGFRDVIGRMMRGDRLGQATDQFNIRWAALSTDLAETLDEARLGRKIDQRSLANQWVARDDARNYVLFGDPAVRLRVEDMPPLEH
jgi:Peptidase family C25